MTSPEAKSPERDPVAAAIYHCVALRHHAAHWTNQHANREYVQAEARAAEARACHRKEGAS
jgi:hypothetical protein